MPFEERVGSALQALAGPMDSYRSAVATTLEAMRGRLSLHRADANGRAEQLRAELGRFAEGRIDAGRLLGLLGDDGALAPAALGRMERAHETLRELTGWTPERFRVDVEPGGDVRDAVETRLAEAGRAFGAARVAESARSGLDLADSGDEVLAGFAFRHWNSRERRLAPPLVVAVAGADLRVAGLAEFLDGAQKIVLVVNGDCPPAALVRLITPGTLVIQAAGAESLERLAKWSGPAVAALVPETAARFVHDPSGGREWWQRLTVEHTPAEPRRRVGGLSALQQAEELRQLAALAAAPGAAAAAERPAEPASTGEESGAGAPGSTPAGAVEPADRLAAWLLSQAGLPGSG